MINQGFQSAWEKLPINKRELVQSEIMERLGISVTTFYNKCSGRSKIRKTEIPFIKKIFKKYKIDIYYY